MTTRFVHVVRCKQKNDDGSLNDSVYADVQVIDQVCITDDNGGQETFNFTAANAVPTIVDVAGDGGGVDNGSDATRQSRLIRVTNPSDSTQYFNEEVLDKFCITRHNGSQEIWDFSDVGAFIEATIGPDISAGTIASDGTLVSDESSASRLLEVDEILPGQTSIPPPQSDGTNYMAIGDLQAVCLTINGGQQIFNFSDDARDITDTTQYTTDSEGNPVPPDNTDPDPYVVIPSSSSGIATGNALVQQGLLWKIINFSSGTRSYIVGGNSFDGAGNTASAPVYLVKEDGTFKTLGIAELDDGTSFLDGQGGYAWEDSNIGLYQRFNAKGGLVFTEPSGSVVSLDKGGNLYWAEFAGSNALIHRVSPLGVPIGTVSGASGGYQANNITAIANAIFAIGFDISGNTVAQKLTFDGSSGWGPVSLSGSPVGCATDGADVWILTANLTQTGGNLIKLSGASGAQIMDLAQTPIPAGMDVDGSGNAVVLLVLGGGNYLYTVKSYARDGGLNWSYHLAPPGPAAPSEDDPGWLPAGARGIGGNSGGPSIAAGVKTIALAYGWQYGPFVPTGDITYALQATQAYTGDTGFLQQGDEPSMETALANLAPLIGSLTITSNSPSQWFVVTTATAYTGGGPPQQVNPEALGSQEAAQIFAGVVPVWSSAEVVTTGQSTGAQIGSIQTFLTGLDAKTGAQKWQLTGNGTLGQAPDNPNAQPLTGTLPFVPVVNRTGR
jgi:hypothetical protein